MPRNRRFLLIGFAVIFLAAGLFVHACPYCPPTDPTFSEKLAEAEAVCVVKFLRAEDGEELSMQKTTFRIVRLLKPSEDFKVDSEIEIPIGVTGEEGQTFLLFGKKQEGTIEWSLPVDVNEESLAYIEQAPSPESKSKPERLVYFLNCLANSNSMISNDAFSEFARADLDDVQKMVELLPEQSDRKTSRTGMRTKIRKWLMDPSPGLDVRRGF